MKTLENICLGSLSEIEEIKAAVAEAETAMVVDDDNSAVSEALAEIGPDLGLEAVWYAIDTINAYGDITHRSEDVIFIKGSRRLIAQELFDEEGDIYPLELIVHVESDDPMLDFELKEIFWSLRQENSLDELEEDLCEEGEGFLDDY